MVDNNYTHKKIKTVIEYYGHSFFHGKKILDLGCGNGDVIGALFRLGADSCAVDARDNFLNLISKKNPGIKIIKSDLDLKYPFPINEKFDLTLSLDLICHLKDYEKHIREICSTSNQVVIETSVCDSDDPNKFYILSENKSIPDNSYNGLGCVPSSAAIERILLECGMIFERFDNSKLNHANYNYTWKIQNSNAVNPSQRRMWFAKKSKDPDSVILDKSRPQKISSSSNFEFSLSSYVDQKIHSSAIRVPDIPFVKYSGDKNKFKVALCISGHLRTFEDNFLALKTNLIDQFNCDIFISTYDTIGAIHRAHDSRIVQANTTSYYEKIYKLFSPKKIEIEPQRHFNITPLMRKRVVDHRDVNGVLSMFYKIRGANNLKKQYEYENGFVYDCVIRYRPDIFLESSLNISEHTDFSFIHFPEMGHYSGYNDQLAFSNSKNMDYYSSLFDEIEKYLELGCPMVPERLLKFHLDQGRVSIAKNNIKYIIKRPDGHVLVNDHLERFLGMKR